MADERVWLLGLDVGSTTTSAVIATARIAHDPGRGRPAPCEERVERRLGPVPTPYRGDEPDLDALAVLLDDWTEGLPIGAPHAAGAMIAGAPARAPNADELARLTRDRLGGACVAVAADPVLRSWLAFRVAAAGAARERAGIPVLNLDIGGHATNAAVGIGDRVASAGTLHVGARHVRVRPGSLEVLDATLLGRSLLEEAGGEPLRVVDRMVAALEDAVLGRPVDPLLLAVPLRVPRDAVVMLSGGVGALVHAGEPRSPGAFGDLGGELARAIRASDVLRAADADVNADVGTALYGIALGSAEIERSSAHVDGDALPLRDLPVVARLEPDAHVRRLATAMALLARTERGGCIVLAEGAADGIARVRRLGDELELALAALPERRVLVLALEDRTAAAVGAFATRWGRAGADLVVVDGVEAPDAAFVTVAPAGDDTVRVTFHAVR